MPQVAVIAKITALPGKRDEVVTVLSGVVAAAQQEEGTLVYTLTTDTADDVTVWFYELYADDAAFAAHSSSDAMKAAGRELRDKAAGRPEIHVLQTHESKGLPG